MSEEEKKAIEYLKRHIIPCYGNKGRIEFMLNDVILNLIEKQQKEIIEEREQKEQCYAWYMKESAKRSEVQIENKKLEEQILKQSKIIDRFAETFVDENKSKEDVIKFFTKLVEGGTNEN